MSQVDNQTKTTAVQLSASVPGCAPKILDGINVICIECGADLTGKVRIQNDIKGYVKCLNHGLGVTMRVGA